MKKNKIVFCIFFIISGLGASAQDPLLKSLTDSMAAKARIDYTTGTFKALYVVNMKTIEAPAAGALNVEFQHRFGTVNSGAYNLFGLDFATLRLSLDYGISDQLSIGLGRSSYLQTFDGYLKYKLIRQSTGLRQMPFSICLLGTSDYYTHHFFGKDTITNNIYRLNYTAQLLIARKFSSSFSLQLTPTFIHYNMVPTVADQNNVFALSGGARMKISKRMALTAEYNYLFPNQLVSVSHYNSFSLGWDIETGGHVFQLVFTNSVSMVEPQYIGQTIDSWGNGGIYFGFNLSRIFNLKTHK